MPVLCLPRVIVCMLFSGPFVTAPWLRCTVTWDGSNVIQVSARSTLLSSFHASFTNSTCSVQELRNVGASASAALRTGAEQLAERVSELRTQLTATLDAFDTAQRDADRVADEVRDLLP